MRPMLAVATRHALTAAFAVAASAVAWGEPLGAQQLLESRCYDCHGNGAAEGGLALDHLAAAEPTIATRESWRKVWKMVRQEFMPPVDAEPLSTEERRALTRWVEQAQLGVDPSHPDPGRVTMRRLNRVEYEYTVSDLFGVDLASGAQLADSSVNDMRLRDMLPPDDTAYGFDNIGDFQSLSPALLEKYFDIAEMVVSQVIVTKGPWFPAATLDHSKTTTKRDRDAHRMAIEGEFEIGERGLYRVEVKFTTGGWQDYGGGYDFRFEVDGAQAAATTIDVGGNKSHKFSYEATLAEGIHKLSLSTVGVTPDSDGAMQTLELNPRIQIVGPITAEGGAFPASHQRIFFAGRAPSDPSARADYAREILARLAARAFRRPPDPPTLDRLTALALGDENFERGVGEAIVAILTSPRFLFRTELQPRPDDPKTTHALDDYALASRLSYLLWLSLPDAELTALARRGELRAQLPVQVARMLADRKSDRFFEDFAGQWLRTRNVLMTPISRREKELEPIRAFMKRETEMLFEDIARNDRDLMELVTADYTYVNDRLADYYGVEGVDGGEFRRVALPASSHRGGILTQASFLISTSNPDRTSPVKRGLFVLENLLATQPPPPPANVPALEDAHVDGRQLPTVRDQLEAHRADPACAACHAHFDPIGIVLENYDAMGKWREDVRGAAIDPSATTATGENLAGIDDLKSYIAANRERYYRSVAEKLMTYALGRGLEPFDAITIDEIADKLQADGGRFSTLLTAVVASPAFGGRRGDDNELKLAPRIALPEAPPPEQRRPMRRFGAFNRQREDRRERSRDRVRDGVPDGHREGEREGEGDRPSERDREPEAVTASAPVDPATAVSTAPPAGTENEAEDD